MQIAAKSGPAKSDDSVLNSLRNTLTGAFNEDAESDQERIRSLNEHNAPAKFAVNSRSSFTPSLVITTWFHPKTRDQYTSVYIWLPTYSDANALSVKAIDKGCCLQVEIQLPPPFHDMELTRKRWLKSANGASAKYNTKYMA